MKIQKLVILAMIQACLLVTSYLSYEEEEEEKNNPT